MAYYDDGTIYDSGALYLSTENDPTEYVSEYEVRCHRLSVIIRYRATVVPGVDEAFRIYDIRPRLAIESQQAFTHEAFIDAVTPSERLSPIIKHRGSEFQVSHIQLIAQPKQHQPKG